MAVDPSASTHADVGRDQGACRTSPPCYGVLIARVSNFGRLRRAVGSALADKVGSTVAVRLGALLATDRVTVVARDTVQLVLEPVNATELVTLNAVILQAFEELIPIGDIPQPIDLALGAAVAITEGVDELRVIEEAEAALADAIRGGAPAIRTVDRQEGAFDRAALSRDLVTAMRDGELLLHYQPKLHLRRRRIVGLEALIRWQHPARGLIYPGDFIPLAEQSGDIAAMTLWAIRRVIADQKRLGEDGHRLMVFVNIAGALLTDQSFVGRASELVSESAYPIGFEITETSVIRDARTAIANLQAFHAIGIAIAIDDYGAGLSSLAYLKQLPACELKIDKLFVTQLASSHRDPLIVRSTIDLAHALEMEVVAEGVENQAALALLSVMGCDMAQGFFISRPLAIEALLAFLEEHRDGWREKPGVAPLAMFARRA